MVDTGMARLSIDRQAREEQTMVGMTRVLSDWQAREVQSMFGFGMTRVLSDR